MRIAIVDHIFITDHVLGPRARRSSSRSEKGKEIEKGSSKTREKTGQNGGSIVFEANRFR